MAGQTHFFAMRDDLLPILEAIEGRRGLRYLRSGWSDTASGTTFDSAVAIPNLGTASHDSAIACDSYLLCRPGVVLAGEFVPQQNRYLFDQLLNPTSVSLLPGGLWGDAVLLYGMFGTVSSHPDSLELLRELRRETRKRFKRIKAYYVGPEAERMLDSGMRLTLAVQTPTTFDLAR